MLKIKCANYRVTHASWSEMFLVAVRRYIGNWSKWNFMSDTQTFLTFSLNLKHQGHMSSIEQFELI